MKAPRSDFTLEFKKEAGRLCGVPPVSPDTLAIGSELG
jgi:hypothetical protein